MRESASRTTRGIAAARALAAASAVCALAGCAVAPNALATQRFADPSGSTTGTCAPPDPPCTLQRAIENPQTIGGDEVVVNPGTYNEGADRVTVTEPITVHGAAGQAVPVINGTANSTLHVDADAATVRRLVIANAGGASALEFVASPAAATGEQIFATSTTGDGCLFIQTASPLLRDTVCVSTGVGWAGVEAYDATPGPHPFGLMLRNVTAVGAGPSGRGIVLDATGNNGTVDAKNVISRGPDGTDVTTFSTATGSATVSLSYSNYESRFVQTGNGTITDPTTNANQTAAPAFVDATSGDFHQAAGSPTIDAGGSVDLVGALDVDGEARSQGGAPDIGADEFTVAVTEPEPGDTSPPDTAITNEPKHKTKKKTATFEFTSSEPASTFECSLDGGQFQPCASPDTLKVKKGKHNFQARATDPAGNTDPTPATQSWKVKKKR